MPTQRERAYVIINTLKANFKELSAIQDELRVIMGEAQNPPPEGAADGSIDTTVWKQLQGTERALSALLTSLLFHGKSESEVYWEGVRRSAQAMEGAPAWKTAGIVLNPRNFQTSQPDEVLSDDEIAELLR